MTEVAFTEGLRQQLQTNLDAHDVRSLDATGRRRAAVAVIVLDSDAIEHGVDPTATDAFTLREIPGEHDPSVLTGSVAGTAGGASVLLTRRTAKLKAHAGQWALPGGRLDEGETLVEAAQRETDEEVGMTIGAAELLGRLDDYPTRSGYIISPFVFWGGSLEPVANPDEVASLHRIGLHELCREDSPRFISIPESDRPVIQLPVGGDLIHAPTAALLYQFRAVAFEGRGTRVDHLEQPVFAWK